MKLCSEFRLTLRRILAGWKGVEQYVDQALRITTVIKDFLTSPVADLATALIPGTADDNLRARLVYVLKTSIDALSIVDKCRGEVSIEGKVRCFAEQLLQREPAIREALLAKLAALITAGLDNNQKKQAQYDLYVQARYTTAKN